MTEFKNICTGFLITGIMIFSVGLQGATGNEGIVERIKKVGSVCVEGGDCSDASTESTDSGRGEDVAAIYNRSCATCHSAGVAGAPIAFDPGSWSERVAKGMSVLYKNAIDGMPPGMPAKGLCMDCSEDQLKALVDYMLKEN